MTADEEKISSLYQQGKDQGPPAHLDNAILSAACEAVQETDSDLSGSKSAPAAGPFSGGWRATASIAAVLLITVILVPLINEESPQVTESGFSDDNSELMLKQELLQEQKSKDRFAVESANMKAKKRSILKAPAELQRYQSPAGTMSSGEQAVTEEELVPMRAVKPSPMLQRNRPASPAAGLMADRVEKDIAILSPQEWLQKIRQLISQGDIDAAQQELDEFKAIYPDEEVAFDELKD